MSMSSLLEMFDQTRELVAEGDTSPESVGVQELASLIGTPTARRLHQLAKEEGVGQEELVKAAEMLAALIELDFERMIKELVEDLKVLP